MKKNRKHDQKNILKNKKRRKKKKNSENSTRTHVTFTPNETICVGRRGEETKDDDDESTTLRTGMRCDHRYLLPATWELLTVTSDNMNKCLSLRGGRPDRSHTYIYGTARQGAARHGTVWYGTIRDGTVRYDAVRYLLGTYGTARYDTVRCATVW